MKTNIAVLWVLAVYFIILTAVYTVWAIIDTGVVEWIGSIAIGLSAVLSMFIAFYLQVQLKNQGGVLPEDRLDADVDDGDPEIGFYSPWSWWPVILAAGAGVAMLGFSVGIWVAFYAIPLVLVSLIGWTYEYYRGYFAR
jgi:ribose/xylose/arabinose/galactoside ABC-type transport system permease subunit